MKYLFLMRGLPGAGKSTYIPNKYKSITLEPDDYRLKLNGIYYDIEGKPYINQDTNKEVWENIFKDLEKRMKRGSTIIIDATHTNKKSIKQYKNLVKKYNYKTIVIDFSNIELEKILEQNKKREAYKQVPEEVIFKLYEDIKNSTIPKWIDKIYNGVDTDFESIIKDLYENDIKFKIPSGYGNLFVIGDLHGMYKEYLKLKEHIDFDNDFVIFLGDYFDRFPSEEELILLFKDLYELSKKENVVFIKGNHEEYRIDLNEYEQITRKIKTLQNNINTLAREKENIDEENFENLNIEEELKILNKRKNELYKKYKEHELEEHEYKNKITELKKIEKKLKFNLSYKEKLAKYKKELEILEDKKKQMLKKIDISRRETLTTLEKNGYLTKFVNFINQKTKNYMFIENDLNKKIFLNHGGFIHSLENEDYIFFNEEQFISGTGTYGDEKKLAENFTKLYPNTYQFFGHRDIKQLGPKLTENVYTLNGSAEFGGDLRGLLFDLKKAQVKNVLQIYTERETRYTINKEFKAGKILELAKKNRYLVVKELDKNIYSINFSREAFFEKNWNNMTLQARGLFVYNDSKTEKIIARGFPKFFNLNEMENTKKENIKKWKFPLIVEEKSNGFLGIFSVYKDNNKLIPFIASKSTNKSVFAGYFQELLKDNLNDKVLNYVNKHNLTLLFEVIHKNDPHIQEYEKNELVLIGAIKNELNAQPTDNESLEKIFKKLFKDSKNIRLKKIVAEIKNYQEFENLLEEDKKIPLNRKNYIEGYVIYSKDKGYEEIVKLKTNWYSFWKNIRSLIKKIDKYSHNELKKQIPNLKKELLNKWNFIDNSEEIINNIFDYLLKLKEQNVIIGEKSVIEFRKEFINKYYPEKKLNNNLNM